MKWLAIALVAILIISLFFPWVSIESKNIVVTGLDAKGTSFGEPGLFNLILCVIFLCLLLINRNWSKRAAFFVSAFNIAWAFRNFVIISKCYGGTCPIKHTALYVLLFASILIAVCTLFVETSQK